MNKVNIGTYSIGGFGTEITLLDKLKTIAKLGYSGVEFLAMDMKNSVEDLKAWLNETGLECISLHASMDLISENIEKMAALGGKMIICPGHPFNSKAEAIQLAKMLEEKGREAAKYGIKIGYHNHTQEFFVDEGKPILEYVIENSDPSLVYFQLDCGWATAAGCDCPAFIKKYNNRICSVHVKENNQVVGPGDKPRGMTDPAPQRRPNFDPATMTEEEKAAFAKMRASMEERTKIQCPIGDPSSNISWKAIKAATDAQSIECVWTVEREGFHKEREECLIEDCEWLKANL